MCENPLAVVRSGLIIAFKSKQTITGVTGVTAKGSKGARAMKLSE